MRHSYRLFSRYSIESFYIQVFWVTHSYLLVRRKSVTKDTNVRDAACHFRTLSDSDCQETA